MMEQKATLDEEKVRKFKTYQTKKVSSGVMIRAMAEKIWQMNHGSGTKRKTQWRTANP